MRPTSPPSKPFLFPLCFFLANFRDGLLAALFASNWSKSNSSISFGRAIRTDHWTHQSTCTPIRTHGSPMLCPAMLSREGYVVTWCPRCNTCGPITLRGRDLPPSRVTDQHVWNQRQFEGRSEEKSLPDVQCWWIQLFFRTTDRWTA